MTDGRHLPVMLDEVVTSLAPRRDDVMLDGTFGGGGYSRAILDAGAGTLFAIDRDPAAKPRAQRVMGRYGERFTLLEGCFGDMEALLGAIGISALDGVVLDIGVSSFQLDEAERGFSFQADGPLDMRMSGEGESAADVVNIYAEAEIADILFKLGEERASRRIAKAIVEVRDETPFQRTRQLAELVERVIGAPRPRRGKKMVHPATKSFQALRIHVNDELGELRRALVAAEALLRPGGRLVVVSFHSLEDRIVKSFMAERGGRKASGSRHLPQQASGPAASFMLPQKSAVKPTKEEEATNPRSRSARLRVAVRTDAPAWGVAA